MKWLKCLNCKKVVKLGLENKVSLAEKEKEHYWVDRGILRQIIMMRKRYSLNYIAGQMHINRDHLKEICKKLVIERKMSYFLKVK